MARARTWLARARTWLGRALLALLVAALLVLVAAGAFLLWLRTPAGNAFLTRQLVAAVDRAQVEGDFQVEALRTDLFGRAVLDGVALTDGEGRLVLGADRLVLRYRLLPLLGRRVQLDQVAVHGLHLDLVQDEEGLLDLQRIFGQTEPAPEADEPFEGFPLDVVVDDLQVLAPHIRYRTPDLDVHLQGLVLRGAASAVGPHIEVREVDAHAWVLAPDPPGPLLARVQGSLGWSGDALELQELGLLTPGTQVTLDGRVDELDQDGRYAMTAELQRVDLDLVDGLAGEPGLQGVLGGRVALEGPAREARLHGEIVGQETTRGTVAVDLTLDLVAPELAWGGEIRLRSLHLHDLYPQAGEIVLDGHLAAEGRGTSWPDDLQVRGRFEGGHQQIQTLPLDRLSLSFALDDGLLTFEDAEAANPLGTFQARGELDLVDGPLDVHATGTLDLAGLALFEVTDLRGRGPVRARVTGNVLRDPLALQARGAATLAGFRYQDDVAFGTVHADFTWRMVGEDMAVDAQVSAASGEAYGVQVARLELPELQVDLPADAPMRVGGEGRAEEVAIPDLVAAEWLTARFVAVVPDDAEPGAEASLVVGPHEILDFPGTGGVAEVQLADGVVAFDVDLDARARDLLVTRGTFDTDSDLLVLESLLLAPTARQTWRGVGEQRMVLTEGGVADARLRLRSDLGEIGLDGTVGTVGPWDAEIAVEGLQLDVFAELFPEQAAGLSGLMDLQARASGTAEDPFLAGEVQGQSLWVDGAFRWLDIEGGFALGPRGSTVDLALGVAGEPLATVDGSVPVLLDLDDPRLDPELPVDARVAIRPGHLERFDWLAEEDLELPDARLSASLDIRGPLRDPDFHLVSVVEQVVPGWTSPARFELDVFRHEAALAWWADVREGLEPRGAVSGTAQTRMGEVFAWALEAGPEPDWEDWTLWADDLQASVLLLGAPVESLLAAADLPAEVGGQLLGGFTIEGSPFEPRVQGGVHLLGGRLGEVPVEAGYLALLPDPEGYAVDLHLGFPGEGEFAMSGVVPLRIDLREDPELWREGVLALEVGGRGLPLGALAAIDPGVVDARGLVAVRGAIRGTLTDPRPDVAVVIEDGMVAYQPLGVRFQNIRLDVRVRDGMVALETFYTDTEPIRFTLQRAFGTVARSRIMATGSARLEEWQPVGVGLQIVLDQALLAYTTDQALRMSGRLRTTGRWPELRITGNLGVDQGRFVMDEASFVVAAPLQPDPALRIHRGPVEEEDLPPERPEPAPPFYQDFQVAVGLNLNRNVEFIASLPYIDDLGALGAALARVDLSARLGGELDLHMVGGEPQLVGEVDVIEGRVRVMQSLFEVEEGTITFVGGDPTNPFLDIQARMVVAGGSVVMRLTGTADDPDAPEFFSEEFPDQTEIFTILLTGRSPEELTGDQGEGAYSALAAMLVASALGAVHTHSLSVEPDGTIRVGIPVQGNLHVRVSFDPTPRPYENRTAVQLEWTPARSVVVEGALGDQHSWLDAFWQIRF